MKRKENIMLDNKSSKNILHRGFLVLGNTQQILTQIWHQIWDKNDGENICCWNIFKSHEPFQIYKLSGPANSACKAG